MKPIIAYFDSHNAALAVYCPERDLLINVDIEKVSNKKHARMYHPNDDNPQSKLKTERHTGWVNAGLHYLEQQFGIKNDFSHFVTRLYHRGGSFDLDIINADKVHHLFDADYHHHECHAYSGYGQSDVDEAFCITWDGIGDDTAFAVTEIAKDGKNDLFEKYIFDFSMAYIKGSFRIPFLKDTSGFDIAGKLMGYSAYGHECDKTQEWVRLFQRSARYKLTESDLENEPEDIKCFRLEDDKSKGSPNVPARAEWRSKIFAEEVMETTNFRSNTERENFAFALQKFLEDSIIELIDERFYDRIVARGGNLLLSGGTSLNVLINEKLKNQYPEFTIRTNCCGNDSGLSFGLLYNWMLDNNIITNEKRFDLRYSGMYPFDFWTFNNICALQTAEFFTDAKGIADLLRKGKIIGLVQGRCEFGPRALGNRSILADPSFPEMKEVINDKVKHREWFRPFAPVCRMENVEEFFDSKDYSNLECMGYAVQVREEYQEVYPSITHVDGTARVQTVTRECNELLYDILGHTTGVLLNTSLNKQGQPILNRIDDAIDLLIESDMDYLVVETENGDYRIFEQMVFLPK